MTKAQQLFQAELKYDFIEEAVIQEIVQIIGKPDWNFEDITFDYYDLSFELKQVEDGFEFDNDQLNKINELGFAHCWLCYKNGLEKTYATYNINPCV